MENNLNVMQPLEKKRYYRVKELAEYMGVSATTIWNLTKNEDAFPKPKKLSENTTVWEIDAVHKYMDKK